MAAVALVFRRYIGKMYLADQGSLVSTTIMRDIVNAAFYNWLDQKADAKLRVRFSTVEEKELIDLIQSVFGVKGDGISETKWSLRSAFEKQYKSPLWALKYVVDKGSEFNLVVDELFKLANATGDSITQDDVSRLLEGLKKQKTTIALTLEKVQDSACINAFVDKCLATVNYKLDNYSNLMAFLKQNLSDAIVFWREEDVEKQVLLWCALQSKQPVNPPSNNGDSAEDDTDINPNNAGKSDVNSISGAEDDYEADDDLFESPDFEPIDIEPIAIGKTHATIEETTKLIYEKQFNDGEAKEILVKLCKEYPVVCSAVMKFLGEE